MSLLKVLQNAQEPMTRRLHKRLKIDSYSPSMATWRSGYATVCKTVYAGSIPAVASKLPQVLANPRRNFEIKPGDPCFASGGRFCYRLVAKLAGLTLVPR